MVDHTQAPQTVAFAGDWHGNMSWAIMAIDYAHDHGADTILHLGDFGIWQNMEIFTKVVQQELAKRDMRLYFIDGNHEQFPYLYSFPVDDHGFRVIEDHVFHIPRGHVWDWDGLRFMGLGGAYSIDRMYRKLHLSWFLEEVISEEDVNNALHNGAESVDVLLTHDAPDSVNIPLNNGIVLPEILQFESYENRRMLGRVVNALRPALLLHGHYHLLYQEYRPQSDTTILGLNCDKTTLEENMRIVDLQNVLKRS